MQRQRAYIANNYCCWACGVHKTRARVKQWLEAHEFYDYDWKRGWLTLREVTALCHLCHNYIHVGRLEHLLSAGDITEAFFLAVILHGDRLTDGMVKPVVPSSAELVPWTDWRMVIDGVEYGPTSNSYEHWADGAWKEWKP